MKQLPLPFTEPQNFAADDFLTAPSNALAREWLAQPQGWTNGRLILWGEAGCGKTHLLHIFARDWDALVISGSQPRELVLPFAGPLAIDDADAAADEVMLLHVLNTAAEAGQPVLLTARLPPARAALQLADLGSRLRASLAVEIRPPEDELLTALLARLAADRQLYLSLPVQNYLLARLPRTPGALREAVARLDHAALDRGSKITRPLAAELLQDLTGETVT